MQQYDKVYRLDNNLLLNSMIKKQSCCIYTILAKVNMHGLVLAFYNEKGYRYFDEFKCINVVGSTSYLRRLSVKNIYYRRQSLRIPLGINIKGAYLADVNKFYARVLNTSRDSLDIPLNENLTIHLSKTPKAQLYKISPSNAYDSWYFHTLFMKEDALL